MWALYFDNHKEASRLCAKFPSWCRSYLHILYQSTVFQSCGIPKHLLPTWLLSMSVHLWCVCTYLCPTNSVIVSSSLIKVPVLPYTQSKVKRSAGHRITHYAIRLHDIKKRCFAWNARFLHHSLPHFNCVQVVILQLQDAAGRSTKGYVFDVLHVCYSA